MTSRQSKPTHCDRIEAALRRHPAGVTNTYLNRELGIFRYSARIEELRKKRGLNIETIRESGGVFRFRLIGADASHPYEPGRGRRCGVCDQEPNHPDHADASGGEGHKVVADALPAPSADTRPRCSTCSQPMDGDRCQNSGCAARRQPVEPSLFDAEELAILDRTPTKPSYADEDWSEAA